MNINQLLKGIPGKLTRPLATHYERIKQNFIQKKYEPAELNGAKFSEVVLRILQWYISPNHTFTPLGKKVASFEQATRQFQNMTNFPDSIRFHIPRILNILYGIRNKRGVGHVGGDVNPNHMDALLVVTACDWVLAELIRILHDVPLEEAQNTIESIISKQIPFVWEVEGRKRVLKKELFFKDKVLLLLYNEYPKPIDSRVLFDWTEHSNSSGFKRDVLKPLHKKGFIEYSKKTGKCHLSPKGSREIEERVLQQSF